MPLVVRVHCGLRALVVTGLVVLAALPFIDVARVVVEPCRVTTARAAGSALAVPVVVVALAILVRLGLRSRRRRRPGRRVAALSLRRLEPRQLELQLSVGLDGIALVDGRRVEAAHVMKT